ncbi:MAG: tRNA (adenosine(37)-N6)-threonylcarbamoyltransferase complex ATPase subunit type 1 TsaE [Candidatus Levybacteria bacterium]|nr:tRNA (adenosine(37)-N6)-threonylcarbamoyltransferase complex ATPase subunit type 1 TsaE [Candidatus Levybacteria bacterium]
MKKIITESFEQTQKLGSELAQSLNGGEVLALHGDLGSGKTTFMQGFAKGLGIKRNIISPTFIIMRTYVMQGEEERGKGKAIQNLYHVDLYRIENERDVEGLGLFELLGEKENIVAIEWPEKIENLLPKDKIDIYFEYMMDDKRSITFST